MLPALNDSLFRLIPVADNKTTMYIPKSFHETDVAKLHDFMQQHSFATLISSGESDFIASHIPLLLDREAGQFGRLTGHLAKPNTQWQSAEGERVLIIYHGPHAYISPTWYDAQNVVPTWNYVTVHAYGVLKTIDDPGRLYEVIRATVEVYEASMPQPWSMLSPDTDFIEKLMGGIVGFDIQIDRLEGKWKLSQNHPAERREKVIHSLMASGDYESSQVASLMIEIRDV